MTVDLEHRSLAVHALVDERTSKHLSRGPEATNLEKMEQTHDVQYSTVRERSETVLLGMFTTIESFELPLLTVRTLLKMYIRRSNPAIVQIQGGLFVDEQLPSFDLICEIMRF
jgi:hypothetical protein